MEQRQRFSMRSDIMLRTSDDCAIVVDLIGETVYSANGTGARVLQLIAEGLSFAEIITTLAREYQPEPEQLESDLRELLDSLIDRGIVEKRGSV